MADIVDGIWGIIRNVIVAAFVLVLCFGIVCAGVAFIAGMERERKQQSDEMGWRTVYEGRLCSCDTNGLYRIQTKEN